ncbi:DNA repair and recombination protein radC-like isoform X1 [Thrips palmi]|uniref:DNA repair and recombination protein radC-like isoform X1 n=1 Tax=Thrips palmi TaxID=161013 RepID=A0A6P8ZKJ8_THRPL|nr:DNA repair and recombination protein radC-like isoform X1 [Thrips palmi]
MDPERLQIVDIVNKIFGESGWSFSISNVAVDYIDDSRSGNYSAGASAVVRVQRSNGVFREDIGFGSNWGPNKADVIAKAKKDAVTDGLKGAVINFGGDMARQVHSVTPRKSMTENLRVSSGLQGPSLIAQSNAQPANQHNGKATSPSQAPVLKSSVSRSLGMEIFYLFDFSPLLMANLFEFYLKILFIFSNLAPTKQPPVPQPTSPLAVALPRQPQASTVSKNTLSEEELAKMERIKRQQQRKEEFLKKHQLEQAQAQSKSQDKGTTQQSSREPLKEQQSRNQPSSSSRGNGPNGLIEADDEVMLSTQDMEAISAIAANNTTNISRHSPMLSSPSITRNVGSEPAKPQPTRPSKRPDLNNFAFNPEKKQRS